MLTFGRYGVRSPPDPDILASELKLAIGPIVASKHAILRAVLVMLSDPQGREKRIQHNSVCTHLDVALQGQGSHHVWRMMFSSGAIQERYGKY